MLQLLLSLIVFLLGLWLLRRGLTQLTTRYIERFFAAISQNTMARISDRHCSDACHTVECCGHDSFYGYGSSRYASF